MRFWADQLILLPILLPLLCAALLVLFNGRRQQLKFAINLTGTLALLVTALVLFWFTDSEVWPDGVGAYLAANWAAPFGIVLVVDRLAALMLTLCAVIATAALVFSYRRWSRSGVHFHSLFQFLLAGINGAFITGDLFNLFVFFEILLISSYALLLHGLGAERVRSGVHYVVLNLFGSALFLIGVAVLYGLTGTLNMVDLAVRIGAAEAADGPLLAAAGFMLLVVFGLKAAIMPLYFWLPSAYAAATAPVAALFAIMTKVGLYAILRVFTLLYGSEAGALSFMVNDWLWPLAMLTVAAGVFGAIAARSLQVLLAYLVVVSVGTLLAGIALGSEQGLSAALYYLVHSTFVAGGLFLLADLIARQRGAAETRLVAAAALRQPLLLGTLFFAGAISVAGLPPFSGFIGKVMLLSAVEPGTQGLMLWAVILLGGLGMVIALSRAGSLVFWLPSESASVGATADPIRLVAAAALLLGSLVLVVWAQPLQAYVQGAASQLLDLGPYLRLIQGGEA